MIKATTISIVCLLVSSAFAHGNLDYDRLFFSETYQTIKVESEITFIMHHPSEGVSSLSTDQVSPERLQEWQQKQLEPGRQQTNTQIVTMNNGEWSRELIAEAGDIALLSQHYRKSYNLNTLQSVHEVFELNGVLASEHERPDLFVFTGEFSNVDRVKRTPLTAVTLSEQLGEYTNFPIPHQQRLAIEGVDPAPSVTLTDDNGYVFLTLQFDESNNLTHAAYEDALFGTRELEYLNWITDRETGITHPETVTVNIYHEELGLHHAATPLETRILKITNIETDF